ncbi:MAG: hypothetical protein ACRDJE_15085 [Dehalococcoidia bacterium]
MSAIWLRRGFLWPVLLAVLVVVAMVLLIVWTANEREWYVDAGGISGTINLTLTDGGRWAATAVLGLVAVLTLGALLVELATSRSPGDQARGTLIPPLSGRAVNYAPSDGLPEPAGRAQPSTFASAVVGDDSARRLEGSLPEAQPRQGDTEEIPAGANRPV